MTKIKICGIRTTQDALAAIEAGANYLGFNFYPASPRFVDQVTCAKITSVLKREHPTVTLVGVFVNLPVVVINDVLEICSLDLAQLHGDESPEILAQLGPRAFKAFRSVPNGEMQPYIRGEAPAFLLDAAVNGAYGGTGITANWFAAAELAASYPLLLAGGLNPANVADAMRRVNPWGVDVASGVESQPGQKEVSRMRDFVQAVHAAAS